MATSVSPERLTQGRDREAEAPCYPSRALHPCSLLILSQITSHVCRVGTRKSCKLNMSGRQICEDSWGCERDKADCKCPCCVTQATCMKGCVVGDKRGLLSSLLLLSHFKKKALFPPHIFSKMVYQRNTLELHLSVSQNLPPVTSLRRCQCSSTYSMILKCLCCLDCQICLLLDCPH